jgi:phosphosulfolactate synthase (CoM biosynthesis protein A)
MQTGRIGYSIVDSWRFAQPVEKPGIDVFPGLTWVRGEIDDSETQADFLSRAMREAADAGFKCIEVSGFFNLEVTNAKRFTEDADEAHRQH